MRGPLALLLLSACLGEAYAQGKVERIDIVESGLYRAQTASVAEAPDTASRQRNILRETMLLAPRTRVEAKIGVHFGMR